jgi:hypothetical protein
MWNTVLQKVAGTSRASWIPVPDLRAFVQTARQYFMHPALSILALASIAAAVFLYAGRDRKSWRGLLLGATIIFGGLVAPWIVSHVLTPIYVDRYTIPALAGVILLLAWSVSRLPMWPRVILITALLIIHGYALHSYYTKLDKEPWREAARYVAEMAQPGDVIVLNASFTRSVFQYYFTGPDDVLILAPWKTEDIPTALDAAERIVLIQSYDMRPQPIMEELLPRIANGRRKSETKQIEALKLNNPWAYWLPGIRVTEFVNEN